MAPVITNNVPDDHESWFGHLISGLLQLFYDILAAPFTLLRALAVWSGQFISCVMQLLGNAGAGLWNLATSLATALGFEATDEVVAVVFVLMAAVGLWAVSMVWRVVSPSRKNTEHELPEERRPLIARYYESRPVPEDGVPTKRTAARHDSLPPY